MSTALLLLRGRIFWSFSKGVPLFCRASRHLFVITSSPFFNVPAWFSNNSLFKRSAFSVAACPLSWVQLHARHGERHGGGHWVPVRRRPNRQAAGAAPLDFGPPSELADAPQADANEIADGRPAERASDGGQAPPPLSAASPLSAGARAAAAAKSTRRWVVSSGYSGLTLGPRNDGE